MPETLFVGQEIQLVFLGEGGIQEGVAKGGWRKHATDNEMGKCRKIR